MALNSYDLLARRFYDADLAINCNGQGSCYDLPAYLFGVRQLNQEQVKLLGDLFDNQIQALMSLNHTMLNSADPTVSAYVTAIEGADNAPSQED